MKTILCSQTTTDYALLLNLKLGRKILFVMDESIQRRAVTTTTTTRKVIRRQVNYNITSSAGTSMFSTSGSAVTVTLNSPQIPASPQDHTLVNPQLEISGGGPAIEPIDINSPHTVEELDEKRENEKVYDYLCRLYEVRNWFVECLHSSDIAKEDELEQNLSNGVLLARLANSFAPDVVSLPKIFDIDQSRYFKEGQPCYRHTDNIILWKDAARSVHFPEILIPDTVDIYEGRNVKTIFSLYALAKQLHRMRRGPPIRRETGNIQFSPTLMDDARERLKESDLSMFGDIDGILATTPGDIDAHMKAIKELNKCMDNKESMMLYLKNPDTGILYVNDTLATEYQRGLLKRKQTLRDGEFLNREQIQTVITEINDAKALKQLEYVLQGKRKPEISELNVILDDLQQEDILRSAGPLYAEELYKIRSTQNTPLTLEQVEAILQVVNMCMRVRFYALEDDEQGVYDALKSKPLCMETILSPQLKATYKGRIREEYRTRGQDYVLMPEQLHDIVRQVNGGTAAHRVQDIVEACKRKDITALEETLQGLKGVRKELTADYLDALLKAEFSTTADVERILELTNKFVAQAESDRKLVEDILLACQNNDFRGLAEALKGIKDTKGELAPYYLQAFKRAPKISVNDVQAIIIHINETIEATREKVHRIELACQEDDCNGLTEALKDVKGVKAEYVPYYLEALKKDHHITIEETEEVIDTVNRNIENNRRQVDDITLACERNDPGSLAKALQGVSDVRSDLMARYISALRNTSFLTREDVQRNIAAVNELAEQDDRKVHDVMAACQKEDKEGLLMALEGVPKTEKDLLPYYLRALKSAHYATVNDIIQIIVQVNETVEDIRQKVARIAAACQKDDKNGLTHLLQDIPGMRVDLMPHYLSALKNGQYATLEEIEEILYHVNETAVADKQKLEAITAACRDEDYDNLLKELHSLRDVFEDYIPYYMNALKKHSSSSVKEVEETIQLVNQNVADAVANANDTHRLNMLLSEGNKSDAAKLLIKSWPKVVRTDILSEYVIWLMEEIVMRRKKWAQKRDADMKTGGYLPVQFNEGILYLNIDDGAIVYRTPERIIEWMLTRREIEKIIKMINDKNQPGSKHNSDVEIAREAASRIQHWWRKRLYYRDLNELRTSEKPSLRVVRRFTPMLVRTNQDKKEDSEMEEDKAYAMKLIHANQHLEELLFDLDDNIAKLIKHITTSAEVQKILEIVRGEADKTITRESLVERDPEKWKPYEIILFYLQTQPEYLSRLMAKHSDRPDVLPDLLQRSVFPIYSYGATGREMSLMALMLRNYLHLELKKVSDPVAFRHSHSRSILRILMELYGKNVKQRSRIAEINKKMGQKENQIEHFNLIPENIFESVTGHKPQNTDEAMGNATVAKVLNDSKQFLSKWAIAYANVIFENVTEYPDIVRYVVACVKSDMKEQFQKAPDDVLMQAVGAWFFKGCCSEELISEEKAGENEKEVRAGTALRGVICKFIEYGILNFGYGVEKYWMGSLNDTIGKINVLFVKHLNKSVLRKPPVYKYDSYEQYMDLHGPHRPALHISLPVLSVIQRRLKSNVDEVISNKKSQLYGLIMSTMPPDDNALYVTIRLRPFSSVEGDGTDNQENLLERTKWYVEQCLLSGCPGNNLTQLLAHHTLQKEEDNFRSLLHQPDDQPTLADTKRQILQQLSTLEKIGLVSSLNSYQTIITAIAKDINQEHRYRKNRKAQLTKVRELVLQLEKARSENHKRLEAYEDFLEKVNRQGSIRDDNGKPMSIQRRSAQRKKTSVGQLIKSGLVTAIDGYPSLQGCDDVLLEISTTERQGVLKLEIFEPAKQATFQTDLDFQQLTKAGTDPHRTIRLANKMTVNAQKLIDHINQTVYAK